MPLIPDFMVDASHPCDASHPMFTGTVQFSLKQNNLEQGKPKTG